LRLAAAAGAGAALAGPLARSAFGAPTASYDDGTSAVPPGLAGDPERVIIVGAGWAGLTLANALRNAGIDHALLEGRNRIGGRAHTTELAGVPVDLGCSWIHQPYGGNPMARFADQAGVARRTPTSSWTLRSSGSSMRISTARSGR
jgi:monoamine oxidase